MLLLASFVTLALACGEITVSNFPQGDTPILCGTSMTLQWTYGSDAMDYFSMNPGQVEIVLKKHNTIESDPMVAVLATVNYPAMSAMITFPSPFPQTWLDATSDIMNDGSEIKFTLYVDGVGNGDINSKCTSFLGTCFGCTENTFSLQCCPMGAACMSGGTCKAAQVCNVPNATPAPSGSGANGTAAAGSQCNGPCAAGNKCTAVGCTTPLVPTGSTQCICTPGTGTAAPSATVGSGCMPGSKTLPAGSGAGGTPACSSSTSPLLACVANKCAMCTTGAPDCACANSMCTTAGYTCTSGRCIPNTGCLNCPCSSGTCGTGLLCANNMCIMSAAPGATTAAVTSGCTAGQMGCPCAMVNGAVGCSVQGLSCKNGICSGASHVALAMLSALVAVVAVML